MLSSTSITEIERVKVSVRVYMVEEESGHLSPPFLFSLFWKVVVRKIYCAMCIDKYGKNQTLNMPGRRSESWKSDGFEYFD